MLKTLFFSSNNASFHYTFKKLQSTIHLLKKTVGVKLIVVTSLPVFMCGEGHWGKYMHVKFSEQFSSFETYNTEPTKYGKNIHFF